MIFIIKTLKNIEHVFATRANRIVKKIARAQQTEFDDTFFFFSDFVEITDRVVEIFEHAFFMNEISKTNEEISTQIAIMIAQTTKFEKIMKIDKHLKAMKIKYEKFKTKNDDKYSTFFRSFFIDSLSFVFFNEKTTVDYINDSKLTFLFIDFSQMFSKMMLNIQHRKFNVKNIFKLTADFAIDFNEISKLKSMNQLIKSFEMFCQIVCALISTSIQQFLQLIMTIYRVKLLSMIDISTFVFVQNYHMKFIARVIRIDLDDSNI